MTSADLLAMLKVDLGISTTAYDTRLGQYLQAAEGEIRRQGAAVSTDFIDHCNIIVMYAAWMWRKRDTGEGMPRMVRYAVNNLVFSQKMAAAEEEVQSNVD